MSWISFGNGFVAAGVLCGIVAICVFALRALGRKSALFLAVFAAVSVVATIKAQKTNGVNNIPPQQMMMPGAIQGGAASCRASMAELEAPPPCGTPYLLGAMLQGEEYATVTADDIARGWRVESVATNAAVSYAMPTNGTLVGNWHVHGASSSFGNNRIDFGDWCFPLGTNGAAFSSFWYFIDGRIRPTPKDAAHEICAVGAPMSAVPGQSRLWTAEEPDGARVLTWENFFLGGDTNVPVNAQIRLYPNGDFTTRSNDVETVCRRVNPDDWDDDGIPNDSDLNPLVCDGDFFGPANILPDGANTNAYCTVSLVATGPDTLVVFEGDGPSDYPDPCFVARHGETNEVLILIGKTYSVSYDWPVEFTGSSDAETEMEPQFGDVTRVVRRVDISASDGNPFTMSVVPSNLGGVFSWNASDCGCSISGGGNTFSWNCSMSCTCCGTYADGWYSYEGYRLPATSCACGCRSDGEPEWTDSPGPLQPSVSVSFSKDAVIFEDSYENEPGQLVGKQSTRTRLNIVANGGPDGGTLTVTPTNLAKLERISGPDLPLAPVIVPPETQVTYSIVYEGAEASDAADDVAVAASVVGNGSSGMASGSDSMTSVRLELAAVWEAPENPCTNRHVYGVGERVRIRTFPESVPTSVSLTRIHDSESSLYDNMIDNVEKIYACPVYAAPPNLKVVCHDAEYRPAMTVCEPNTIICKGAAWDTSCLSPGTVGGTMLATTNYVGPMNVSFRGILVSEIPCVHTNTPTGFFATTNFTGQLTHWFVDFPGGAMAFRIKAGNYWTVDRAGHPGAYRNWSAGRLEWDIPIGWFRLSLEDDAMHVISDCEYEIRRNDKTRPFLIGGRMDAYKQVFSISEDGTASIEKHGHTMSRSRNCRVLLDGTTIQWTHWL